jgi:CHC2 zinc finger
VDSQQQLYESLQEIMEGTPYDGYFAANCPFHNDSSPSLMVYESDGKFYCKSCRKSGNLKFLASKVKGGTFRTTQRLKTVLPRWSKWERRYGNIQEIALAAHQSLLRNKSFQGYFKRRKIDQFIKQGMFGYLDGWNLFPVLNADRKVIDIVVRANRGKGNTRYVLHPDHEREFTYLYVPNWERISKSAYVYVVYGIIDAWALEALDEPVVTGTSGKSLNADILKPLNKYEYDIIPDKYEESDAANLCNSLGWMGKVLRLKYKDDCKDPDDVRVKHGERYLYDLIIEELPYGSH